MTTPRALAPTILAIDAQAVAPRVEALREADRVLADLAARDATAPWGASARADLVQRADAAHRLAEPLLAEHGPSLTSR
jgi:hypothetical protein